MKAGKTHLIKARVSQEVKDAVTAAAAARGTSGEPEAIIVREAIDEYLLKRGWLKKEQITYLRAAEEHTARTTEEPARVYHEKITPAEAQRREKAARAKKKRSGK